MRVRSSVCGLFFLFFLILSSHAAQFTALGSKTARAISADGFSVIGSESYYGFRWQRTTNILLVGYFSNHAPTLIPRAVSSDGSSCVGIYSQAYATPPYYALEGVLWFSFDSLYQGTLAYNGTLGNGLYAISADGNIVAGIEGTLGKRWTRSPASEITIGPVTPAGISADGSIVVGTQTNGEAFYWTTNSGVIGLGFLGGTTNSAATAISGDGGTIVGTSGNEAFVWRQGAGMVGLGDLPGGISASQANAVSADGTIIVGAANTTNGQEAFIWDATNGMRNLKLVLQDRGIDLSGTTLSEATGISADGVVICGNGSAGAWVSSFAGKVEQTITNFSVITNKVYGDAPFTISATASSGLPVEFSVLSGPALVSSNTVTITGGGMIVLQASQPGNSNYAAVTAETHFIVYSTPLVIKASNSTRIYGDANPPLSGTITGLVNNDNITATYSTVATPSSAVGSYPITVTVNDPDHRLTNYTLTTNSGILTVKSQSLEESQFLALGMSRVALAISADGSSVVGANGNIGFRWSGSSMNLLSSPDPILRDNSLTAIYPVATSSNGNVCVGTYLRHGFAYPVPPPPYPTGAVWANLNQVTNTFAKYSSLIGTELGAVSADGTLLAGISDTNFLLKRWNVSNGTEVILGSGKVSGMSADGSMVVGTSTNHEAFYYTTNSGQLGLGFLDGTTNSEATAISGDGGTIVGVSGTQAFLWRQGTGMVGLGDLPDGSFSSKATAVSADGTIIVGWGSTTNGQEAFIWDATNGMRRLQTIFESHLIDLSDWTLTEATGVSANGTILCGNGTQGAWVGSLTAKASQTIDLSPSITTKTYGDDPFTLTPTAASGLPVLLSVLSGPATSVSNLITITGTGTVTIRASQAGDSLYKATTYDTSFSVTPAPLSISADNVTRPYGQTNPILTGSITGLKNDDAITVAFSTGATASSPIGNYPIAIFIADPNHRLTNYSVTSVPGTLTISIIAPSIVTEPQGKKVVVGASQTFTVDATGGPLNFQWRRNGTSIAGATNSAFSLNPVKQADQGQYSVLVTNTAGGALSQQALLTVIPFMDDIDQEAHIDILVQSTNLNSFLGVWNMAGTNLFNSIVLNGGNPLAAGLRLVGHGDFNHDGHDDLLFQNDGVITTWLMNGTESLQSVTITKKPIARAWKVMGARDLNQDGQIDIILRHDLGYLAVWLMNGTNISKSLLLQGGTIIPPSFKLLGLEDFDKDGAVDFLWQQSKTGKLSIWYMKGTTLKKTASLGTAPAPVQAWQLAGLVDLNEDGNRDILWQNTNRTCAVWFLDGTNVTGSGVLNFTLPTEWNIAGEK